MAKKEKSLISLIKEAIITHSSKDVQIHQHTFAAELIETSKESQPFSPYDFLPRSYRGKKMILTRHVVRFLRNIVLFAVAFIYAIYDLAHLVIKGKPKSHPLDEKEHQILFEKTKGGLPNHLIKKTDDGHEELNTALLPIKLKLFNKNGFAIRLHPRRWRGIQPLSGLNSIIAVGTFVCSVLLLIMGLHFLVKEVILPDNNSYINSRGVVSIDQGCLEEHHFFLLNAANSWTQTGITINQGDEVYITASGSMYSDVDDYCYAAELNRKPEYAQSSFSTAYNNKDDETRYCIFGRYPNDTTDNENRPQYGSLLYQICSETQPPHQYNIKEHEKAVNQINFLKNSRGPHPICNWFEEETFHFEAENSGLLQFCFNDILLDTAMIETIYKESRMRNSLVRMCPDSNLLNLAADLGYSDSSATILRKNLFSDSKYSKLKSGVLRWLKDNVDPSIWLQDNLGEALINIRVIKSVRNSDLPFYKKVYVRFHRLINWLYYNSPKSCLYDFVHSRLMLLFIITIAWFLLDRFISRKIINKDK